MPASKKTVTPADLGITLSQDNPTESFKWFLACLLFGKPIQQDIARKAYLELERDGITSPEAILHTGWDGLVDVLDRGHYVRYDYSTATKLLDVSRACLDEYGSFGKLLEKEGGIEGVEERLRRFSGVGPKTVDIFLRDMRGVLEGKGEVEQEVVGEEDAKPEDVEDVSLSE